MRQLRWQFFVVVLTGPFAISAFAAEPKSPPLVTFREQVRPLLAQFCFECHGRQNQEADVSLPALDPDLVEGSDAETWHDVLNKLNLGEMPPEDAPRMSKQQRETIVRWLTGELKRAVEARRSTGGRVVLRRLTRYEYANTMRDLLGIELDYARNLPPEPSSPDGFKNNGSSLGMSPLQLEYYLQTARSAIGKAIVTGERPQVYRQTATTSESTRRKKEKTSNRVAPDSRFLMRMPQYPTEGRFRVRVEVAATAPEGAEFPTMRVALGLRSDVLAPEKTLAEVEVTAKEDVPQTFEFYGRIEEFPLPGHNPKYPGLLVTVWNSYDDGKPKSNQKKKPKGKKDEPDPTQPVLVVKSVEFEGPVLADWPPKHHTQILFPSESAKNDERSYVRQVFQRFMQRAFRRPVTDDEVDLIVALYDKVRPTTPSLETAVREVLPMVLISPDFLYLLEPAENSAKKQPLNEFELASRLSYFLWSTMPDENLFELARSGKLRQPDQLARQVRAMIDDPRSWNLVEHFTNQWLQLSALDRVAVNPEFYPEFDDRLKVAMRKETQFFFAEILHQDLSAMNLLDSDFTMLNRALARHYGISGPQTAEFERVTLKPEDRRGGLLAQGSILLANSTGEDSHPIKRGVWLLDRLLDDPPPPPPPDVPELNQDEPDLAGLSVRMQLEVHRKKQACNSCHRRIDPWGIPLESFDAVGLWRGEIQPSGKQRGKKMPAVPVEVATTLPNGQQIDGLQELKSYLLEHEKERFARATVRKLLAYSLGRSLEFADNETVELLTAAFAESEYRLGELIVAIVNSEAFRTK